MATIKDLFTKEQIPSRAQTELEKRTKDMQFIQEHVALMGHIQTVSDKRVFCLKGIVKQKNPIFRVGDYVWYVGDAPKEKSFPAFFIAGKSMSGQWKNIKFVARFKGALEFKYIDVPLGFAKDNGLYHMTKDQMMQKLENAIELRKQSVENGTY